MKHRILYVTSSSDIGGTERQLLHLLGGLDRSKWDLAVYSLVGAGELTRRARAMEVQAEHAPASLPAMFGHFAQFVREYQPQITHLFGLRADVLGRRLCRKSGADFVLSGIRNTDPWRRWWHVWADRLTSRPVDLFVSNSMAGRESRIRREGFPPERIVIIPNGIAMPNATARSVDSGPRIGLVGNLRPRKGHDLALAAFAQLLPGHPDARLIFVGQDFMQGALSAQIAALGLDGKVDVLGFREDPAEIYATLDLFIQPSRYEGTPNTLMEAMSWGIPCIATAVGGVPEVLRHEQDGVLIPTEDVRALARAMDLLLADESRRNQLGENARRRIQEGFSVEVLVARHDRMYEQLLKSGFRPELGPELLEVPTNENTCGGTT